MTPLKILQELGFSLYVPREKSEVSPPLVIVFSEKEADFSEAHHAQFAKIIHFLGLKPGHFQLSYQDSVQQNKIETLLSFGPTSLEGQCKIITHSISEMLHTPPCKRAVLHAIQPLRHLAFAIKSDGLQ